MILLKVAPKPLNLKTLTLTLGILAHDPEPRNCNEGLGLKVEVRWFKVAV